MDGPVQQRIQTHAHAHVGIHLRSLGDADQQGKDGLSINGTETPGYPHGENKH